MTGAGSGEKHELGGTTGHRFKVGELKSYLKASQQSAMYIMSSFNYIFLEENHLKEKGTL